jgi:hypothetical protein
MERPNQVDWMWPATRGDGNLRSGDHARRQACLDGGTAASASVHLEAQGGPDVAYLYNNFK